MTSLVMMIIMTNSTTTIITTEDPMATASPVPRDMEDTVDTGVMVPRATAAMEVTADTEAMETTTASVDMEGKEEFSANLDTADTAMEVKGTVMATVTAMELARATGTDMATVTEAARVMARVTGMATTTEAAKVTGMATTTEAAVATGTVMARVMEVERATVTEFPTATVAERCLTPAVSAATISS